MVSAVPVAGFLVMGAGTVVILVGAVALFRSTRFVDDVRRSRAFFFAMCVLFAGAIVGYVGVWILTGESPFAVIVAAVVVVAGAGALWRYNVVRAEVERRRTKGERR